MSAFSPATPWATEISPEALSNAAEIIYVLDRDLRFVYCNPAWDRFALANGGERWVAENTIGTSWADRLPAQLRGFYLNSLALCLRDKVSLGVDYECSSSKTFRSFRMHVMPLKNWDGLVVINALTVECGHKRKPSDHPLREYVNGCSVARLCANCRRAWNFVDDRWDWVPVLLDGDIRVSHALCPVCLDYTYRAFLGRSV